MYADKNETSGIFQMIADIYKTFDVFQYEQKIKQVSDELGNNQNYYFIYLFLFLFLLFFFLFIPLYIIMYYLLIYIYIFFINYIKCYTKLYILFNKRYKDR